MATSSVAVGIKFRSGWSWIDWIGVQIERLGWVRGTEWDQGIWHWVRWELEGIGVVLLPFSLWTWFKLEHNEPNTWFSPVFSQLAEPNTWFSLAFKKQPKHFHFWVGFRWTKCEQPELNAIVPFMFKNLAEPIPQFGLSFSWIWSKTELNWTSATPGRRYWELDVRSQDGLEGTYIVRWVFRQKSDWVRQDVGKLTRFWTEEI